MHINLDNIGIVKNSRIELDGLTVITGKNNSGKTTVGKTVYSMLDAVCDMPKKAKSDRRHYIVRQLEKVKNEIEFFRFFLVREDENEYVKYKNVKKLVTGMYRRELRQHEVEKYAHDLLCELQVTDILELKDNPDIRRYFGNFGFLTQNEGNYEKIIQERIYRAIIIIEKMFIDIDKDLELIDYARKSVNQTLNVEFAKQIQPVKDEGCISRVGLLDEDAVLFDFTISNNKIVNEGERIYYNSPFQKVYLIDDPYILDDISTTQIYREYSEAESEDGILNSNRIHSHSFKLKSTLRKGKTLSVFEETVLDDSLKKIKNQIDSVIPGSFEFANDGDYYIQNGAKLKIVNLAAGSKMFSIIKMLLEYGEIDETTMLILDEPEAHLHPMWQNAFAETIVLLVKEAGVNVLLTTHSANFMLAIDAFMRKYDISDKTNFYQTDKRDDGFVQYRCVNHDMGKIYDDFLQYLSEVKMLRNHYLHGLEE